MKTSTILFLVGTVVIVGGGALAFTVVTKPATEVVPVISNFAATTTTAQAEAVTTTGSASILGLIGGVKSKSVECTFVLDNSGVQSEGTGFFIDGKARVDTFYTDADNRQIASYMIMDTPADTMYVWTLAEGEQTGLKMSLSANEKMVTKMSEHNPVAPEVSVSRPQAPNISPETDVQYICKPWSPDTTVFIPPTDVNFTDMTEMNTMMDEMMEGMTLPTQ